MILEVKRIPNSWQYDVPGFGKAHIEEATLGKSKGKLFLISENYSKVAEINVLKKHIVKVPFNEVNVADKIEIVQDNLSYKEVFFSEARKTRFVIEDGEIYEGFTYNQHWNGWEMPMFEREIAEKILKDCEDLEFKYDNETDTFTFKSEYEDDDCEETEKGHDILADNGKVYHVYDIGAGNWIWSEECEEDCEEDE